MVLSKKHPQFQVPVTSARLWKYRLRLQGYGPESDIEHRADEVPQCNELIAAYGPANGLNNRASHNEHV